MVTMLASFHACGTEPSSQALVINWCSLLDRLSPPCFHTSAGIPSPPGALPSFRPAIALAISSMFGISSRHVLVMRCWMLTRASCSMLPGTLSSFWLVSSTHGSSIVDVHLIPTPREDEVDHMPVSGTRMPPGGLAFILLLEHGVRHYHFELRAQSQ